MYRGAKADVGLCPPCCKAGVGLAAASAEVKASWLSMGIALEQAPELETAIEFCRLSVTRGATAPSVPAAAASVAAVAPVAAGAACEAAATVAPVVSAMPSASQTAPCERVLKDKPAVRVGATGVSSGV